MSITTWNSFLLSYGSIFSGTKRKAGRNSAANSNTAMPSSTAKAAMRPRRIGDSTQRERRYSGCRRQVELLLVACARWIRSSETIASQGVIKNATTVEIVTVSGTFNAIGAMYGPIMPVMKASGRKLAMIASVDRINAGRTSWIARSTDCARWQDLHGEIAGDVLDVGDRIVDQQTQRQNQGEHRDAIDRVADQQIDEQRQAVANRNRQRDHQRRPPADRQADQTDDGQHGDDQCLRPVR